MAFPMFSPIQRQESFRSSRKIAKTPTSKTLTVTVKWPHPKSYKANPATLADAGFYWNPNSTAKDNVSCFFCEEDFSDWEVHHDPHVIHYDRCGGSCAWATARCGVFAVDSDSNQKFRMGNDPDRLPCGKFLETNRYTIFVHGDWPHDKTRGHAVTSRKMAGAGFLFTPHESGDDTAKCPYCGIELSGWDPDDDPVVEHRRRIAKRGTECPFFTARITELPEKKTIRKIASKASLQTPKLTRTRSTKATNPEPDSDDREENLGRSTRSRATKATKTPARAPIRNAAASRSREPSVAETDEPSESDAVEVTKPKAKGSKRKPKARTPIVEEEDESEAAPPRKSTRAKKIKGGFEDVEMDVNFEELKPRRAQPPRSTRSRSKAPTEGSDSDASVKSVRSTRSTRSNRGTSAQSKKKVVEEETEEEMATPVQKPKKTTRSMAPPKSTKGRKPEREESIESESSGLLPTPPPKPPRSARKSQRKIIESESEEWQSAREDVAPTPRPSTTKKARGRPPKVAKTPKAPPKPTPVPPSPTPISDVSHVSGSYMSESELHIPVRDGSSKASKPSTKSAAQPFHEKPSNRDRALAESRTQPLTSSRLPSTGSKENTEDRNAIIIDASDDEDDARRFVASKSMMPSSNPSKIHNGSTNGGPKLKTTLAQKRDSFIGVVLEPSPRMRRLSAKVGGNVVERPEVDMDVDEVTTLDQPSRSVETDRDSPVVVEKGKVKTMAKPEPLSSTSEHKQRADIRSEVTDSAMDVDDGNGHEVRDGRSIRDSRQPSTPRRDPPARFFRDDSNPFATGQANPVEAANPLSAFGAGNLPAEVLYALVEEEKDMTVEEWTKRESEIQLELFKEHGLRRLLEFKEKAAEVRRQIEAL